MFINISKDIEIVGQRPGEKLDEDLISAQELEYTEINDNWIFIRDYKTNSGLQVGKPPNTSNCEKMSKQEMLQIIE